MAGRPNKERLISFGDSGIVAGPLFLTLTNLSTGKKIDLNVSGSGHLTFLLDGTTTLEVTGPLIMAWPPPSPNVALAAGLPLVPLINGRTVFTYDEQLNVLSFQSVTGRVQDICELLR